MRAFPQNSTNDRKRLEIGDWKEIVEVVFLGNHFELACNVGIQNK
jgi:hypothetical protein